jgi:hypothetical protein
MSYKADKMSDRQLLDLNRALNIEIREHKAEIERLRTELANICIEHDKVVASMCAEIERLQCYREGLRANWQAAKGTCIELRAEIKRLRSHVKEAKAGYPPK